MSTLKERLEEVMRAMRWEHTDLMSVSKQSSSVVSQWLGKGSKEIKTIGKLEAAIYIERASGFSALWVAKGVGPKRAAGAPVPTGHRSAVLHANEPAARWDNPQEVIERMGRLLAAAPEGNRGALGDVLRGWALSGGAEDRQHVLVALLGPLQKHRPAA